MSRFTKMIGRSQHKRELLEALRMRLGCARCGYKEYPEALHFHHVDPKTKFKAVMSLVGGSHEILEWELKKCTVLCANCHAVVTRRKLEVDLPDPPLTIESEED